MSWECLCEKVEEFNEASRLRKPMARIQSDKGSIKSGDVTWSTLAQHNGPKWWRKWDPFALWTDVNLL